MTNLLSSRTKNAFQRKAPTSPHRPDAELQRGPEVAVPNLGTPLRYSGGRITGLPDPPHLICDFLRIVVLRYELVATGCV